MPLVLTFNNIIKILINNICICRFYQLIANFTELATQTLPAEEKLVKTKEKEQFVGHENDSLQPFERYLSISPSKRLDAFFKVMPRRLTK